MSNGNDKITVERAIKLKKKQKAAPSKQFILLYNLGPIWIIGCAQITI